MSLGPAPHASAHAQAHPLGPRRDREAECRRPPVPAVPRTRRAMPKANSAGALTKDTYSKSSSLASTPTKSSEYRRPREDSPFTHARVHSLGRERDSAENQVFEMGPAKALPTSILTDHSLGHVLGQQDNGRMGMPWKPSKEKDEINRDPARRNTLQHERLKANQEFEWTPGVAACAAPEGADVGYHGRMNMLKREELMSEQQGSNLPGGRSSSLPPDQGYGRRNIMAREQAYQSIEMPLAVGVEPGSDVPFFGRRDILHKEQPRSAVKR